ncbi:PREDICTED: proline-rich receptor-like protein kinase PERK2 [Bison bison bison]|uniref:Proline-rich receptor-like protein kinase PERK2 n=1 Tax=Bison bison bison TaxID=43346 RepID=A0A6P3HSL5_BISBB|nr:PREDICTED: proline-rich receptor-like protein kinase PERK2 [Bison bison bison]
MGEGGGLGSPLPPSTEPLLAPPEPGPTVPRPGLRPRHLSPLPRTRAHPPETARLASFQAPPVGHTSDQGVEGAVKAVGTVTPGLAAPEPRPGPASDTASDTASGLTSNVSKAHVRRRSTDVSALLARPGPPRRSAPLPSAALSSTPRTSAPGSSPTRQRLPGCPRPFCDARGRVLSMRASVGAAWAGLSGEWRHRGPGQARRADVKQAAAVCAALRTLSCLGGIQLRMKSEG